MAEGDARRLVWVGQLNRFQRRLIEACRDTPAQVAAVTGISTGKTLGGAVAVLGHLLQSPPGTRALIVTPTIEAFYEPVLEQLLTVLCFWQPERLARPDIRATLHRERADTTHAPGDVSCPCAECEWRRVVEPQLLRPRGKDWLEHPLIIGHNRREKYLEIQGGRLILYRGAKSPTWDGVTEIAVGWGDELRHWPKDGESYRVFLGRLRLSAKAAAAGAKQLTLVTTTPEAGHWIQGRFDPDVAPAALLDSWRVLHGTIDDNELLSPISRHQIQGNYVGAAKQRYVLGMWVPPEGVVYGGYVTDEHWVPAPIDPSKAVEAGLDFGTVPAFIGLQRTGPEGAICTNWEVDNRAVPTTHEFAQRIRAEAEAHGLIATRAPVTVYYDPAGRARTSASRERRTELEQAQAVLPDWWRWVAVTDQRITGRRVGAEWVIGRLRDGHGTIHVYLADHLRHRVRDTLRKPPEPQTLYQAINSQKWDKDGKPEKGKGADHQTDAWRMGIVGATWAKRSPTPSVLDLNPQLALDSPQTLGARRSTSEPAPPRRGAF